MIAVEATLYKLTYNKNGVKKHKVRESQVLVGESLEDILKKYYLEAILLGKHYKRNPSGQQTFYICSFPAPSNDTFDHPLITIIKSIFCFPDEKKPSLAFQLTPVALPSTENLELSLTDSKKGENQ